MIDIKLSVNNNNWSIDNLNDDKLSGLIIYLVDLDDGPKTMGSITKSGLNAILNLDCSKKHLTHSINVLSSHVFNGSGDSELINSAALYARQTTLWKIMISNHFQDSLSHRDKLINCVVFYKKLSKKNILSSIAFAITEEVLAPKECYQLARQAASEIQGFV